jgi:hypothetical protein
VASIAARSFVFALLVVTPAAVIAQASATGTIPARATIGSTVTLSNPTPLEFGNLLAGQTSQVVPPAFAASSPRAGSIQLDYSDPLTLNVTIDPGGELQRSGVTLTTQLECGLGSSATDASAQPVGCQGQHISTLTATRLRSARSVFIFVGGRTTAPGTAPAGEYTGTITVRVSVASQ